MTPPPPSRRPPPPIVEALHDISPSAKLRRFNSCVSARVEGSHSFGGARPKFQQTWRQEVLFFQVILDLTYLNSFQTSRFVL